MEVNVINMNYESFGVTKNSNLPPLKTSSVPQTCTVSLDFSLCTLLSNSLYDEESGHDLCFIVYLPSKQLMTTVNFPKYSDTQNICCNHSKIWTMWLYHRVMSPNDANGMANSVDPDQTAPLGAVWSGSALFAQTYLSENLGKLRYPV